MVGIFIMMDEIRILLDFEPHYKAFISFLPITQFFFFFVILRVDSVGFKYTSVFCKPTRR